MADLNGKNFIALVRLSDGADNTLADVGETCERVPAGKHGGTVSDALRWLLDSHLIAPAPVSVVAAAGRVAVEAVAETSIEATSAECAASVEEGVE